jgi:hypothetical protein
MDFQGRLLKFKVNRIRNSLEDARYVLTYRQGGNADESARLSHAILSALKGEGELLLELNSSLFCTPDKPKDELIYACIDTAKNLALEYKYSKVPSSGAPSLLEKLLNRTRDYAHELLVRIPVQGWSDEGTLSLILPYGARYYMTGRPFAENNLLESFGNMTDREKLEYFRLIVFDLGLLGHMGINSAFMEPDEVKSLLKI